MEAGHPHFRDRAPDHSHSLRLTFAYRGSDVRLVHAERVAMITPAPPAEAPGRGQAGYWVEVLDDHGNLLYHRPLHDPTRESIEVFGDEPGEPIYRVDNPDREGEFDVLVPDYPNAAEFALHGPAPSTRRPYGPSSELLRSDFEELRRGGPRRGDEDEDEDEGEQQS